MIEIPRAALLADQVAKEAEFFSFGTNDLTQTTMGLSRDDYTKFSKDYEDKKIFKADPFGVLDQEGVGMLIEWAVKKGRADPSRPRNRDLRRARRRAQLGEVLLSRGHGLRLLLPVPCADRPPGGRAGGHFGRQVRSHADCVKEAGRGRTTSPAPPGTGLPGVNELNAKRGNALQRSPLRQLEN